MEMWLCGTCKHLAVGGEAPNQCPVCGASHDRFQTFSEGAQVDEQDQIVGSVTEGNLKSAFATAAQANRKYLAMAAQAELEGETEAGEAFRLVAEDATHTALALAARLGWLRGTLANLEDSVDGEKYESETMYPRFAFQARQEGFADVATYLEHLAAMGRDHAGRFRETTGLVRADLGRAGAPAAPPHRTDAGKPFQR